MRDAPIIQELWEQGGRYQAHTIVTVQRPWGTDDEHVTDGDEDHVIHPTTIAGNAKSRGIPLRWFQKEDNSQNEEIIPNVKSVTIDRSIDQPASTCTIQLYNQWMFNNGEVPLDQLAEGNRLLSGYFTPTRGTTSEAQARWGHATNDWEDTLVPNAVIRTYQGYGGHGNSLEQCLEDGNVILTGIWLVDEVTLGTDGMLEIVCRDTGKLLVEQQLYTPLVPADKYPLTYYRWVYENTQVQAKSKTVTTTTTTPIKVGNKRTVFEDSAVDRWYPKSGPGSNLASGGFVLHGHKGADCLDGNPQTYCLSVGDSHPSRPFAANWWQFLCGEQMNAVYVHPWGGEGGYTMYVSVMENGAWQGTKVVPYDHSDLIGNQPYVVDTGADIPYVAAFTVPYETPKEYVLPRVYNAQRVRVTFRNGTYSGIGPWMYRSGMREFRIRATAAAGSITTKTTATLDPDFYAAASIRDPDNLNAEGYVTVSSFGQIDAFGDCRVHAKTGGNNPTNSPVSWVALTKTGDGFWILRGDGTVTAYGAATYYGSAHDDGVGKTGYGLGGFWWQAICPTPDGDGYWLVALDGRIRAYGSATGYSNLAFTPSSSKYVSGAYPLLQGAHGLFIALTNGDVEVTGAATHYGNWTKSALSGGDRLASVVPNLDGDGYWLVTTAGRVDAKGAATDHGQTANPTTTNNELMFDQLLPWPTDAGYLLLQHSGAIFAFGDANYYGAPIPGSTGQIRKPGNYLDYSDIVTDLALWSGFNLFDPDLADNEAPAVYGNIESTGSFAVEQLPDEMFDKRPVIDAMNDLKEAVGYILFVDDEGALRFHSPNFWGPGNFLQETGERVSWMPDIDESVNLMSHRVSHGDDSLRSLIIVSSEDPDEAGTTTVTTKMVPQTAQGLRGILKPAMWVNGWFQDPEEQKVMAELIAMHIWFAQRLAQVECVANPCIQVDDQVRIFERQTSEVYVHYVRGVHTVHDLDSGSYTMTLTTHWLGTGDDWAVTSDNEYIDDPNHFVVSPRLREWIKRFPRRGEDSLGDLIGPTFVARDPNGPDGGEDEGAAS